MGLTFVPGALIGRNDEEVRLDFLVDSGSAYTIAPEGAWKALGLTPLRTQRFRLADGTEMRRAIGECRIRLAEGEMTTPVILGEPGDVPLLGAVTLEQFGLVLNPFTRTLHRADLLMA
ncbi:MAG: aspartyl protease family protein [Dehalococcoidia bacterium]|nr:aspartyl protease family protein [Dehalococcoidia bacterium]